MGISGAISLIIVIALATSAGSDPADRASGKINETNLAKQTLKTNGLPDLGDAPGGEGSLESLLSEAREVRNFITAGGPKPEEKAERAEPVIEALHGAAASTMSKGLLDKKIPAKHFDSPQSQSDFGAVGKAVSITIEEHNRKIEFDEAEAVAISYLLLGQKIYESNTRLKSRQRGLRMMQDALTKLGNVIRARYDDGEIEKDEMTARNKKVMEWMRAVSAVTEVWDSKLRMTEGVATTKQTKMPNGEMKTIPLPADKIRPNIADLIRIAKEDQDITFRIWAARRLGYALFERGGAGNQAAIKAAIEELKGDSNKQVAAAAADGESIKDADEYYELRKY